MIRKDPNAPKCENCNQRMIEVVTPYSYMAEYRRFQCPNVGWLTEGDMLCQVAIRKRGKNGE